MRKLTTFVCATWLALSLVACNKSRGGVAVIETDFGPIKIQLDGATAPKHVENFKKLARAGFYDGLNRNNLDWHTAGYRPFSTLPSPFSTPLQKNSLVEVVHCKRIENGEGSVENVYGLTVPSLAWTDLGFHRAVPGLLIQGGDPNMRGDNRATWGMGAPGEPTVEAEFSQKPFKRGVLGAARKSNDDHSATSQFFICLRDFPQWDGKYTVFGEVIEGLEVVESKGLRWLIRLLRSRPTNNNACKVKS